MSTSDRIKLALAQEAYARANRKPVTLASFAWRVVAISLANSTRKPNKPRPIALARKA